MLQKFTNKPQKSYMEIFIVQNKHGRCVIDWLSNYTLIDRFTYQKDVGTLNMEVFIFKLGGGGKAMKFMGSKNRISKHILPIMLRKKEQGQWWVEPFVGGGNMIDKVEGPRIGADSNEYLIEALQLIRDHPETIPDLITEEDYEEAKQSSKIDGLSGFIGFAMSFGGKWLGGYRRDVAGTKGCIENMKTQSRRAKQAALKQSKGLQGVLLLVSDYQELQIPANSMVYCDPPYRGRVGYKDAFDHVDFWQWCRDKAKEGHTVFVSEYTAPEDFECVWQKELANTLTKSGKGKVGVEKLFKYRGHDARI